MNTIVKNILTPALFLILSSFHPVSAQKVLTLDEAKQMALVKNNKIKIAQQNINAAKAAEEGVKVSYLPKADGSVTGFYFGKPLSSLLPEYGLLATLGVSQPIYAGGKIKLGIATAGKGVEIQEAQKTLTTTEVLLNVEKAYWQIVNVNEKISLANKYKTLLQALLKELNNAYQAGIIYKNDVLRVQVQLNEAELNLTKAQDGLILTKLNLAQLTGISDSVSLEIEDSVIGNFAMSNAVWKDAANNRPEINLFTKLIEVQKLQEKLLKADGKPSIGLSMTTLAATGKQGINPSNTSNILGSYYGLVNMNIPIFDWGARKQKVKEQSFKIAAQQLQLEETKQLISLEIQQALMQLNLSAKRIELSGASSAQADENLRLSNDRFKAGTVIGKDVLEAQTIWEQASSNLIDAKVEYKINEAIFKKAIGELK